MIVAHERCIRSTRTFVASVLDVAVVVSAGGCHAGSDASSHSGQALSQPIGQRRCRVRPCPKDEHEVPPAPAVHSHSTLS
jgi:hypothetical protein